jgi:hypothetical protein
MGKLSIIGAANLTNLGLRVKHIGKNQPTPPRKRKAKSGQKKEQK